MPPRTLDAIRNDPDYKDITYREVLARTPSAVMTVPRSFTSDISFLPVYDQQDKGACVEFADGKYAGGYTQYKRTGKLIEPSARFGYAMAHIYGGLDWTTQGTRPRDYALVKVKAGMPTVSVVPDDLNLDLNTFTKIDVTVAMVNSGMQARDQGFATVGNNFDEIKLAIKNEGFVTLTVGVGDWSTGNVKPPTGGISLKGYHRVFIYGYDEPTDGNLYLYGRNQWGKDWGYGGNFVIKYNEYQSNIFDIFAYPAAMPVDLVAEARGKTTKPMHNWNAPMLYGQSNADVKAYQNVLRYEGLIPASQAATGYYGDLTRNGTPSFQFRYGVASIDIILGLGGLRAGSATIAALNLNFGIIFPSYPVKIAAWAKAIEHKEGYFAPGENPDYPNGTLAWKYKNPGNLTDAPYYHTLPGFMGVAPEHSFCMWKDKEAGMNALCDKLLRAATGKSTTYSPNMSLYTFFGVYAPAGDGNDPKKYAEDTAKDMGVDPNAPISSFV